VLAERSAEDEFSLHGREVDSCHSSACQEDARCAASAKPNFKRMNAETPAPRNSLPASKTTNAPPQIIVTGDLVREVHVYQGSRVFASGETIAGTRVQPEWGGARLLHDILKAARPGISALGLEINKEAEWPEHLDVHALYEPSPTGFKSDPPLAPGEKPKKVWRVSHSPGYGFGSVVPPAEPPVTRITFDEPRPKVLVIDDGGAGFRTLRAKSRWPDEGNPAVALPHWIVLKMSHPHCEGHLWRHLTGKCKPVDGQAASQLVVVVSADELRRDGAAINRGLSWERTIADTCLALAEDPRFSRLLQAAHVFIVFRREGALWIRHPSDDTTATQPTGTLVFDPRLAEGQWKATLNDDKNVVFGHLSVFSAAIALELAENRSGADFHKGIITTMQRGLIAARDIRLHGHGIVSKKETPSFPFVSVAAALNGEVAARASHQPQDKFIEVPLPWGGPAGKLAADWTIASQNDPISTPLFGLAFQTAIYGPSRLAGVPQARFGVLLTVDREEIETLRGLRQMIQAYETGGRQKRPLCIGAFGPPGAGKNFGIEQIALEVLGEKVPLLGFNLSQFKDPADLIGAFHQVRDKVLGGQTPVVFWDEFDSNEYGWLKFLLAPMQDGQFQSGQLTHTLGKCIFVFAGGTSWDFQHFGPAPEPANGEEMKALKKRLKKTPESKATREKAQADFRLKKGPDFLSRLNGHINVLGPNRRRLYDFESGEWSQPDVKDITFPVRRALMLRVFLKAKETDELGIDRDLLNALLRQPDYRHGARSMEKVVEPLQVMHAPLRLAQLPPPQVLGQHLVPSETFQKLLTENSSFLTQDNLRSLAAAIHENYRRLDDPASIHDPQFRDKFDNLDDWGKATNLAAAARIPQVLAVAGLCVMPGVANDAEVVKAKKQLKRYLDPLRREEHTRWMNYLAVNGWLQSPNMDPATNKPIRDNLLLLHTCLVPFDELDPTNQSKDERAILTLPETVGLVDFKIVPFEDLVV
jgi:hypothetical protein